MDRLGFGPVGGQYIDARACRMQQLRHLKVAVLAREVKWGLPAVVLGCHARVEREEPAYKLDVSYRCRMMNRLSVILGRNVDARTCRVQHFRNSKMPGIARAVQRRFTIVVFGRHIRTKLEKPLHKFITPITCCRMDGQITVSVSRRGVHTCTRCMQQLRHLKVATAARMVQRRSAMIICSHCTRTEAEEPFHKSSVPITSRRMDR